MPGGLVQGDLIISYFDYWKKKPDDLFWAWEEVQRMVEDNPERAWPLVLELIQTAPTDEALSYVAAGPLEEFLCRHGPQFVDRVSAAGRSDPRVRRALQGVWGKNRMKPDVWSAIERLCGRMKGDDP